MDLITLVVVLAIVGFCLWLVLTYIPMPEPFRKAIVVLVVLVVVLYVVRLLLGGSTIRDRSARPATRTHDRQRGAASGGAGAAARRGDDRAARGAGRCGRLHQGDRRRARDAGAPGRAARGRAAMTALRRRRPRTCRSRPRSAPRPSPTCRAWSRWRAASSRRAATARPSPTTPRRSRRRSTQLVDGPDGGRVRRRAGDGARGRDDRARALRRITLSGVPTAGEVMWWVEPGGARRGPRAPARGERWAAETGRARRSR